MDRVPLADRIATVAPLSPRETSPLAGRASKLGAEELIVLAGEKEGVEAVQAAAKSAQERVAKVGEPVIADAKLATGQVGAMATILRVGHFYDQATINDVRGFHGSEHARVDEAGRAALARAARIFVQATRTFLRIVGGTFFPGVVRAGTDAAMAQRPAYETVEAGINAATGDLAKSVEQVPKAPTVQGGGN